MLSCPLSRFREDRRCAMGMVNPGKSSAISDVIRSSGPLADTSVLKARVVPPDSVNSAELSDRIIKWGLLSSFKLNSRPPKNILIPPVRYCLPDSSSGSSDCRYWPLMVIKPIGSVKFPFFENWSTTRMTNTALYRAIRPNIRDTKDFLIM